MDSNRKIWPFAQLLMKEPPHTYLLIFVILIICAVLTYIVPAGQFETAVNESGRAILIPGTYQRVEQSPVNLYQFFNAIPSGLVSMASLIFFVMIAGGSFAVINETKTIDILTNKLVISLQGKVGNLRCNADVFRTGGINRIRRGVCDFRSYMYRPCAQNAL